MKPKYNDIKKHIKKLDNYAKLAELEVFCQKNIDSSCYEPADRKLRLKHCDDDLRYLAIYLHELGHYLDEALNPKKVFSAEAQGIKSSKKKTKKSVSSQSEETKRTLAEERRAWKLGKVIAYQLNIPLGPWYDVIADECVATYAE